MKTTVKTILSVAAAALTLTACDNILDTTSYTERNTSNFPATEEDATQLLTGIYAALGQELDSDHCGTGYFMQANLCSDEEFGGGGQDDAEAQAYDHLMYNEINSQQENWTTCYTGIGRANMAIANLDKVQDPDLRGQLLGEAHILRAYFYFELTQMCGRVPLITTVPESVSDAADYPALATEEEVYGFIAQDLKKAVEIMPNQKFGQIVSGRAHATKWAAEGLLARVYLFYTGFYSDKEGKTITTLPLYDIEAGALSTETISKEYVVKALEDCINNSGHSLLPDYRSLWAYSNKVTKKDYAYMQGVDAEWAEDGYNAEQMFYIACSIVKNHTNRYNQYVGVRTFNDGASHSCVFPLSKGYGFGTVAPAVFDNWYVEEPGDIRRDASIYNIEKEADMNKFSYGAEQWMEETGYMQKKYQAIAAYIGGKWFYEFASSTEYYGTGSDLGRKFSPVGVTILRFADVLLMHSELTQTAEGINQVRARVGLAPISGYSFEALEKERRHELAFEGTRWGDMRRWGKAYCENALKAQVGQKIKNLATDAVMKDQGAGYVARYGATYGFRPYPQTEISLSAGVLTQNAGWTDSSAQFTSWQ